MSKLYLTARTDLVRTDKTARADKNISVAMGYDPNVYSKKIYSTLTRDGDNLKLEIEDMHKTLIICKGTIKDGILECHPSDEVDMVL